LLLLEVILQLSSQPPWTLTSKLVQLQFGHKLPGLAQLS